MIKGRITVTFDDKEMVPKVEFEGDVDMLQMAALPFTISTAYSLHMDRLGDELRKKVTSRGIEVKSEEDKPETKEPASNEKKGN